MKIQAQQLITGNGFRDLVKDVYEDCGTLSICLAYISNEARPDFKQQVPAWPSKDTCDEFLGHDYSIEVLSYFDIESFKSISNCDLYILALSNLTEHEIQEIDLMMVDMSVLVLYQGENVFRKMQHVDSLIRCEHDLLKAMFALGWSVWTSSFCCPPSAFDLAEFFSGVLQFDHGVMRLVENATLADDPESKAKEALESLYADEITHQQVSSVFVALNSYPENFFKYLSPVLGVYNSWLEAGSDQTLLSFTGHRIKTTYQAYPLLQITMLASAEPLEAFQLRKKVKSEEMEIARKNQIPRKNPFMGDDVDFDWEGIPEFLVPQHLRAVEGKD